MQKLHDISGLHFGYSSFGIALPTALKYLFIEKFIYVCNILNCNTQWNQQYL